MKYSTLSEKRRNLIHHTTHLDVDIRDNIIYLYTNEIVSDLTLYNFFDFNNI